MTDVDAGKFNYAFERFTKTGYDDFEDLESFTAWLKISLEQLFINENYMQAITNTRLTPGTILRVSQNLRRIVQYAE